MKARPDRTITVRQHLPVEDGLTRMVRQNAEHFLAGSSRTVDDFADEYLNYVSYFTE
jgi:hypothetical protein